MYYFLHCHYLHNHSYCLVFIWTFFNTLMLCFLSLDQPTLYCYVAVGVGPLLDYKRDLAPIPPIWCVEDSWSFVPWVLLVLPPTLLDILASFLTLSPPLALLGCTVAPPLWPPTFIPIGYRGYVPGRSLLWWITASFVTLAVWTSKGGAA